MQDLLPKIDAAKAWLREYKPNDYNISIKLLDDIIIDAEIIKKASRRKTALGFFGESQVGKSYLVSKLLYNLNDLKVKRYNDDEERKFIEEYNSDRAAEATAVVTRFTKDEPAHSMSQYFLAELFGPGSLIYSIYLGYALEFYSRDDDEKFNNKQLFQLINSLNPEETTDLKPAVVKDVKKGVREVLGYVKNIQGRDQSVLEAFESCWDQIKEKENLSVKQIEIIIKIIFYGLDEIQIFLINLLNILKNRNFPEFVFLPAQDLKDMLDTQYMMDYDENNIEGRISLEFSGLADGCNYPIYSKSNAEGIDLFFFQVLTKEITLYVGAECSEIFDTVDVLDFPGIRGFADQANIQVINFQQNQLNKLAKSGKLRFLFYEYTKNLDVTYLSFCISPGNITADHLKHSLDHWVEHIPKEMIEIAKKSLFTIFTKSDKSLTGNDTTNDIVGIWTTRFKTHFLDEFSWVRIFLDDGHPYKNLFLVYNPSAKQYELANDLTEYKSAFMNNPFVNEILDIHKDEKWNGLNDGGGISYLHSNLVETINNSPDRKKEKLDKKHGILKEKSRNIMKQFFVNPDETAEQIEKIEAAENIIKKLNKNKESISHLLNYFEEAFPIQNNLISDDNGHTGIIPPTPEELAEDLSNRYISSFKTNLKSKLSDIADHPTLELDENDINQIIDNFFSYLNEDEELNGFISDFAVALNFDKVANKKIFHESLKWIILGHFSDLWSTWDLKEIDLKTHTRSFNPFGDQINKWEIQLPQVFSKKIVDNVAMDGNDKLGEIIESFK